MFFVRCVLFHELMQVIDIGFISFFFGSFGGMKVCVFFPFLSIGLCLFVLMTFLSQIIMLFNSVLKF